MHVVMLRRVKMSEHCDEMCVILTLKDVSLLETERIASCEESKTGVAENACCYRHRGM